MTTICERMGHFPAVSWSPVEQVMRYRCLRCGDITGEAVIFTLPRNGSKP